MRSYAMERGTKYLAITIILVLLATEAMAQTSRAGAWGHERTIFRTSGDTIDSGTQYTGTREIGAGLYAIEGEITGAQAQYVLPDGFFDSYQYNAPCFVEWDDHNRLWTTEAIGSLSPGETFSTDFNLPGRTRSVTPKLTMTRAISDPVLRTNVETRTITATLTIESGSLAGYDNLNIYYNTENWSSENLSFRVLNMNAPSEFACFSSNSGEPSFAAMDPASLGGTYQLSMDVELTRLGDFAQEVAGNLYFKPGYWMQYSSSGPVSQETSNTITFEWDDDRQATLSAGPETVIHGGSQVDEVFGEINPMIVRNAIPAQPKQILLFHGQEKSISGEVSNTVMVAVSGQNLIAGQVITPNGSVHELSANFAGMPPLVYEPESELDMGGLSASLTSSNPADMADFEPGEYAFLITGSDGVEREFHIQLAGQTPSEFPEFDQDTGQYVHSLRPTVSIADATDPNVNWAMMEIYSASEGGVSALVTPGEDDLTLTPDNPLSVGAASMMAVFGNMATGTVDSTDGNIEDVSFMTGYYTMTDSYLNVLPGCGDANGDGRVDEEDAAILSDNWGSSNASWAMGDFDGDGLVGPRDASIMAAQWTGSSGESSPVPEPCAIALLAAGAVLLASQRRGLPGLPSPT